MESTITLLVDQENFGLPFRPIFRLRIDGFVKSPSAALRFTFVVAAYLVSTPHSSGFARLAYGAFYFASPILTFYETIRIVWGHNIL